MIEGIVRNRYVGRTFIEGENRQDVILRKFTPLRELLENKKIFLVDDSLVRAATLKNIIEDLHQRGKAAEVHVRIACPAIIAPCFYGINIPTVQELFAARFWRPGQSLELSGEILETMARGTRSRQFEIPDDRATHPGHRPAAESTLYGLYQYPISHTCRSGTLRQTSHHHRQSRWLEEAPSMRAKRVRHRKTCSCS